MKKNCKYCQSVLRRLHVGGHVAFNKTALMWTCPTCDAPGHQPDYVDVRTPEAPEHPLPSSPWVGACYIARCGRPVYKEGVCSGHYRRAL